MQEPSPAELAWCRGLLRGGSRSFHAASRLLPRRVRDDATGLYAFCRVADDLIDSAPTRQDAEAHLAQLRARVDAAFAGRPEPHAADRALAFVAARHDLPAGILHALLDGFAWDAEGRQYEDLPALTGYAMRVAGSVGVAMAILMGVRDPGALARAAELGCAMQLTNIARDAGEDARAGRLYLPLLWLRDAGISPTSFLRQPCFTPALGGVLRTLLDEASKLYASGCTGIAALPPSCRPAIRCAASLYSGIGSEVARRGFDSITGRAVLPPSRKLQAALHGCWPAREAHTGANAAPLPQALFLIGEVTPRPAAPRPGGMVMVLDLFGRLQAQASPHAVLAR